MLVNFELSIIVHENGKFFLALNFLLNLALMHEFKITR